MKILVIGSFAYHMYAPAFFDAWKKLGYTVFKVDSSKYVLPGNSFFSKLLNKFQSKYHYGLPIFRLNRDILKIFQQIKPDLVFLYRCNHVFDNTLKRIKDKTIVFSYNNDDPFAITVPKLFDGNYVGNCKYCDLVYVYRPKNIIDFQNIGIYHTKLLLPYYLSSSNYPIPEIKKDIPIAFAGHFEDDGRDKVIKAMYDAGLPVSIFGGDYWITKSSLYEQLKPIINEPKSGVEYNMLLNRFHIALVFLSKRNNDTYTRRCFEIPAAKTLMLSPYTQDLDNLFPEDECAVYYRSTEDLIAKCKYLISHPEDVKRIADAGYERLKIIGGSEIDRCKEIIKDYDIIKKRKI